MLKHENIERQTEWVSPLLFDGLALKYLREERDNGGERGEHRKKDYKKWGGKVRKEKWREQKGKMRN